MKVGIFGAGSIGNHLAFSSRKIGAVVTVCDTSLAALERFRNEIYPSRYGVFDSEIQLVTKDSFLDSYYDVIFIGTPPDSHLNLLVEAISAKPKIICIEKPVSTPNLSEIKRFAEILKTAEPKILAGYNHRVGRNTAIALDFLRTFPVGTIKKLESVVLESWDGILAAHPWLNGPEDSYLAYTNRGGGATFEHSHGIDLWCLFSDYLNLGDVRSLTAQASFVTNQAGGEYDESISIQLVTENGTVGEIHQNVTEKNVKKWVEITGDLGSIRTSVGVLPGIDQVTWKSSTDSKISIESQVRKTRYDDFDRELEEVLKIFTKSSGVTYSNLSATSALKSALIGLAALESARSNKDAYLDFKDWNFDLR